MAIRELVQVQEEIEDIKARLTRLETGAVRPARGRQIQVGPAKPPAEMNREELIAWLTAEGLIREPTAEEYQAAAGWNALSDEEKEEIRWELDHLPPGPMVSDIISENRR